MCNKRSCNDNSEFCCLVTCSATWGDRRSFNFQPLVQIQNLGGPIISYNNATNLPPGVFFDYSTGQFYGNVSNQSNQYDSYDLILEEMMQMTVNVSGASYWATTDAQYQENFTTVASASTFVRDLAFSSLSAKYTFDHDFAHTCESDPKKGRSASSTSSTACAEVGARGITVAACASAAHRKPGNATIC